MSPKHIALKTLENDVLSLELAKLYIMVKQYCDMSQNSKMAVHKKYWDAVMSQIKILDKVVEQTMLTQNEFENKFRKDILKEMNENGVSYNSALETLYELYQSKPEIFEGNNERNAVVADL